MSTWSLERNNNDQELKLYGCKKQSFLSIGTSFNCVLETR